MPKPRRSASARRRSYPLGVQLGLVAALVLLIVDENGNVIDPVVLKGIGAGCDEEALRAISQATFRPGMQRGTPVRVQMSLPITFRLR